MVSATRTLESALLAERPMRAPKAVGPALVHQPRVVAPFFAGDGDGLTLHRYFDEDFVARFLNDAQAGRLTGTATQAWYREDRFGRYKDEPTLRLPMHRSFYLVCSEVQCVAPGAPAFDPKKILSAGMVVRRVPADGTPQRWMIGDGQPLGWRSGDIPAHDPDDVRRLTARGLLPARFPEPPYSGEEVVPLHPLLVRRRDARGLERSHTLLWGYLPLGGSARETADAPLPQANGTEVPDFGLEQAWPLGSRGAKAWDDSDGLVMANGVATVGFIELLQTLVAQFRTNETTDGDNAGLRTVLGQLRFHALEWRIVDGGELPQLVPVSGETVLAWLDRSAPALVELFARIVRREAVAGSVALPDGFGGTRSDRLFIGEQQAADLRSLVALRMARAQVRFDDGLPLPRYGQTDGDRFVAVPFVRWADDCGCERVTWGPASRVFRVASPFDPEAQRPTTVVLPSLDDLKRGLPRGVAMLAPKSLADVLRKISPGVDMKGDGPGNHCGACWSFSFSLPAITLCAMLMLMVVINMLNLFLGWLPWVFLALPRLCLKALKGK
ncbi:hypothetical protein LLG90_00070 [Aromatoleum toluclasticum]|uniref:hypothetical protein n=1 Tax=Aromatoleum toluclasticum TaxID=92003 RepID=UPI001D197B86|nr:hypothetical protein [Aromatoleum toluclasticum]MCC4113739.1 hypothetical protein [Aromatoleum toluclasticum]